jgi:dienelactone hydrolase
MEAMMIRKSLGLCMVLACLAAMMALPADAKDLKGWGIVVMHGKGGRPGSMEVVSSALQTAGAVVLTPTMSWSSGYRTYSQALDEVAGHIAALKAQGATRIALVGQSLGANVALGYGAQRGGIAAIVAMAPGHRPEAMLRKTGESLSRARQAVAAGRGGEADTYADINVGREFTVRTTAAAYVSFFDPDGPALMTRNAGRLRGARLLWIIGDGDPLARAVVEGGTVINVTAGHLDTPKAGAAPAVDWLRSL